MPIFEFASCTDVGVTTGAAPLDGTGARAAVIPGRANGMVAARHDFARADDGPRRASEHRAPTLDATD